MACQTILLDGALGTRLQQMGLPFSTPSPVWNIERPAIVREVHRGYLEAGSQILLTNTFGATQRQQFLGAVKCLQDLGENHRTAASIGPTTNLDFLDILVPAVDFLVLETFSDLGAARKALNQVERTGKPVVVSFVWINQDEFILFSGEGWKMVFNEVRGWPLLALGSNCNVGTAKTVELAERMLQETAFDLWLKPNAGQPRHLGNNITYDQSPEEFARDLKPLIGKIRYLGGCCGSDERFISALHRLLP